MIKEAEATTNLLKRIWQIRVSVLNTPFDLMLLSKQLGAPVVRIKEVLEEGVKQGEVSKISCLGRDVWVPRIKRGRK